MAQLPPDEGLRAAHKSRVYILFSVDTFPKAWEIHEFLNLRNSESTCDYFIEK